MSKTIEIGKYKELDAQYDPENNEIYLEDVAVGFNLWLSKRDLLDMLKLFEEQGE